MSDVPRVRKLQGFDQWLKRRFRTALEMLAYLSCAEPVAGHIDDVIHPAGDVIESIRIPAQQTTTKEKICNKQWFNFNFYEANSVVLAFFLFLSVLGIRDIWCSTSD